MQCREEKVTGQCRTQCDFSRFGVTNLTYHDNVRVLSQNRTQSGSKGQTYLGVDLYLGNIVGIVLDGVFYGNDVLVRRSDVLQAGMQCG